MSYKGNVDHSMKLLVVSLLALVGACNAAPPAEKQMPMESPAKTTGTTPASNVHGPNPASSNIEKDELVPFIEAGTSVLTSREADLNTDGRQDVVVLLEPEKIGEKLGEGSVRTVLLLVRDEKGRLNKMAQNSRVIPCAKCGGISGDPFGDVVAEQGRLTLFIEGGSRERWSNQYDFKYSSKNKNWLLEQATRKVVDTATTESTEVQLSQSDFGEITFEDFDPSKIAPLDMP